MTEENLKKEFETRNLKYQNRQLLNTNTILNKQYKNLNEHFEKRINEEVNKQIKLIERENKELRKKVNIAEDLQQRLEKKLKNQEIESEKVISEKDAEIAALKRKLIEQTKELDLTKEERDKYLAELNIDGTTSGIPTSMTPINKKKIIPNTREKSGKAKGGQKGHQKHKLEAFKEEEINEKEEVKLNKCPKCESNDLKELNSETIKDELDYEIKIIKKRYYFKEYECNHCHSIVRQNIPNHLKEENQYGNKVQAHALSLINVGNVSINKVRRIIFGLTSNEINLSEGYICKLQRKASTLLEDFIKELKEYIITLYVLHWDDTVIFVNGKRACLRGYCDKFVALYTAHEQKDKIGLDEDAILQNLPSTSKVVHDHNKVNYNEDYVYVNVECCVHLERDLEKVKLNIEESTWSKKLKELFSSYNKKRNEYLAKGIESFSFEETNEFMIKFDEYILLGIEENKSHGKSYYFANEKALLSRLTEYRDNYTYWLFDFSIPYTNNEAERGLRGIKTKMKVSGQFQNIANAQYYANIKSYIETCHRNGINEVEALTRLLGGNPYSVKEIIEVGKLSNTKNEE